MKTPNPCKPKHTHTHTHDTNKLRREKYVKDKRKMARPLTRTRAVWPWLCACSAIATRGAVVAPDAAHKSPRVAALLAYVQSASASTSTSTSTSTCAPCPEVYAIARFIGGMTLHSVTNRDKDTSCTAWHLDAPSKEDGGWGFGIAVNRDCSILLVLGHQNRSILAYSVESGELLRTVSDAGEFGAFRSLRSLCVVDSDDDAVFVADAVRGVVFAFSPAPALHCYAALSPTRMPGHMRSLYVRYHGPSAVCADAANVVVYEASDGLAQELTVYERADTTLQRGVVLNECAASGAIVLSIALLQGGTRVAVCNQFANSVYVYNIVSGKCEQHIGVFVGRWVPIHLAVSAFDELVVACIDRRFDGTGALFVYPGHGRGRFQLETKHYIGVAISRSGRLFAQTPHKCVLLH